MAPTAFSVAVVASPATEPGALDGWDAICTCGSVIGYSIEAMTRREAAEHAAWHVRKGETAQIVEPEALRWQVVCDDFAKRGFRSREAAIRFKRQVEDLAAKEAGGCRQRHLVQAHAV